ncbi:hypothetical protein PoB_000996200 [Plakobranchus ocellatus]|uniref:Uncharacterized protein n=1 Tax=Plakobranchus ocellatus TaxID=259542 RepID=A0AAV3YM31_9GAST|nr:hypothetical protein PoB_000996200 [Plakobranchus ocellatus]
MVELNVPYESRIEKAHAVKEGKYLDLTKVKKDVYEAKVFRPSVRPERRWRGSKPRQKGFCKSQGGLASHCATDALDRKCKDLERGTAGCCSSTHCPPDDIRLYVLQRFLLCATACSLLLDPIDPCRVECGLEPVIFRYLPQKC